MLPLLSHQALRSSPQGQTFVIQPEDMVRRHLFCSVCQSSNSKSLKERTVHEGRFNDGLGGMQAFCATATAANTTKRSNIATPFSVSAGGRQQ
jgi:hypothetical protein